MSTATPSSLIDLGQSTAQPEDPSSLVTLGEQDTQDTSVPTPSSDGVNAGNAGDSGTVTSTSDAADATGGTSTAPSSPPSTLTGLGESQSSSSTGTQPGSSLSGLGESSSQPFPTQQLDQATAGEEAEANAIVSEANAEGNGPSELEQAPPPPQLTAAQRSSLTSKLMALFGLGPHQTGMLAANIFQAAQMAAQASAEHGAASLGVKSFSALDMAALKEQALQNAQSITDTYEEDLERQINTLLDDYEKEYGHVGEAETYLKPKIGDWANARSEWKSTQVANWETGNAAGQGTQSLISDVLDGNAVTSDGDILSTDNIMLMVLPDTSSEDEICSEFAGQAFSIDDAGGIAFFPAHPNCIHYIAVVMGDGSEFDEEEGDADAALEDAEAEADTADEEALAASEGEEELPNVTVADMPATAAPPRPPLAQPGTPGNLQSYLIQDASKTQTAIKQLDKWFAHELTADEIGAILGAEAGQKIALKKIGATGVSFLSTGARYDLSATLTKAADGRLVVIDTFLELADESTMSAVDLQAMLQRQADNLTRLEVDELTASDYFEEALDNLRAQLNAPGLTLPPVRTGNLMGYQFTGDIEQATATLSQMFSKQLKGKTIASDQIGHLIGAQEGDFIYLAETSSGDTSEVTFILHSSDWDPTNFNIHQGERVSASRTLTKVGNTVTMHNDGIEIAEAARGQGLGLQYFSDEVHALADFKVKSITTDAAGYGERLALDPKSANGFYTWARFGYDTPLSKITNLTKADRAALKALFPEAKTLQDLMLAGGASWWKANGVDFTGTFILKDGSVSRQALDAYAASKSLAADIAKDVLPVELETQGVELGATLTASDVAAESASEQRLLRLESTKALDAERVRLTDLLTPDKTAQDVQESTKAKVAQALADRLKDNADWQTLRGKLLDDTIARVNTWGDTPQAVLDDIRATYTDQEATRWLIQAWAKGDEEFASLTIAIQEAVQDEFKLKDALLIYDAEALQQAKDDWGAVDAGLRAFARAQYDETQAFLADKGVTELPVYRGMNWETPPAFEHGSFDQMTNGFIQTAMKFQPLTSYTVSDAMGAEFAMYGMHPEYAGEYHLLVAARIPASEVFSTAQTGFGALGELETVLLGGEKDVWAYGEVRADLALTMNDEIATYYTLNVAPGATQDEGWRLKMAYLSSHEENITDAARGILANDWAGYDRILPDGTIEHAPAGAIKRTPLEPGEFPEDWLETHAKPVEQFPKPTGTIDDLIPQYVDLTLRKDAAQQEMFNLTARYGKMSPEANVAFKQYTRLQNQASAVIDAMRDQLPANDMKALGALWDRIGAAQEEAKATAAAGEAVAEHATTEAAPVADTAVKASSTKQVATTPFDVASVTPSELHNEQARINQVLDAAPPPRTSQVAQDIAARLENNPAFQAYAREAAARSPLPLPEGYTATQYEIETLLRAWAGGSAGTLGDALQLAANAEFGLGTTLRRDENWLRQVAEDYGADQEAFQSFLRAMYDNTQEWFKEQGVSDVVLYHGVGWSADSPYLPQGFAWDGSASVREMALRPITSMATGLEDALEYSAFDRQLLLSARVPVEDILSTEVTGYGVGAATPHEMAVLGGDRTVWAVAWSKGDKPSVEEIEQLIADVSQKEALPAETAVEASPTVQATGAHEMEHAVAPTSEQYAGMDQAAAHRDVSAAEPADVATGANKAADIATAERGRLDSLEAGDIHPTESQRFGNPQRTTYKVKVDGETYFVKVERDDAAVVRTHAADVAAQAMGMGSDVVPVRIIENADGTFVVQPWVSGKTLDTFGKRKLNTVFADALAADLQRETLFEYLVGDEDRSLEGYFLTSSGDIRAVDFGGAFDADKYMAANTLLGEFLSETSEELEFTSIAVNRAVAEDLLSHTDAARTAISDLGLPDAQLTAFDDRVSLLRSVLQEQDTPAFYDLLNPEYQKYYAAPDRENLLTIGSSTTEEAASATAESIEHVPAAEKGTAAAPDLSQDQVTRLIANKQTFTDPNTGRTRFWTSEVDGQKYFIRGADGPHTNGVAVTSLADRVGLGEYYVGVQTAQVEDAWYEIQPFLNGHQYADLKDNAARRALSTNKYLSKDERMKISLFSSLINDGDRYAQNMWLTDDGRLLQIDYDAFSPGVYPPSGDLLRYSDFGEDYQDSLRLNDAPKPSAAVRQWLRDTLLAEENKEALVEAVSNLSLSSYLEGASPERIAEERDIPIAYQKARLAAFEQYAELPGTPNLGKLRAIMDSDEIQQIPIDAMEGHEADLPALPERPEPHVPGEAGQPSYVDMAAAAASGKPGEVSAEIGLTTYTIGGQSFTLPAISQEREQQVLAHVTDVLGSGGVTIHTDAVALGQTIHDYLDERIGALADYANEKFQILENLNAASDAQVAWYMGDAEAIAAHGGLTMGQAEVFYAQALRSETIRLLGTVRELGGADLAFATADKEFSQTVADIVSKVEDVFPRDWIIASNDQGLLFTYEIPATDKVGRLGSYGYNAGDGRGLISLNLHAGQSEGQLITNMAHELGHRFEDAVDGISQMERDFYEARTRGEAYTRYTATQGATGYNVKRDEWAWEYMGREPGPNSRLVGRVDASGAPLRSPYSYELLSVGQQWVLGRDASSAAFLAKDEEFHSFTLGLLFGAKDQGAADVAEAASEATQAAKATAERATTETTAAEGTTATSIAPSDTTASGMPLPEGQAPLVPLDVIPPQTSLAAETSNPLMQLLDSEDEVEDSGTTKARISNDIASRLSKNEEWLVYADGTSQTSEEAASYLLHQWAVGSDSTISASLQLAAADEFGVGAGFVPGYASDVIDPRVVQLNYQANADAYRAFLRAMYDNTQQWFASQGITEVPIYRGMFWPEETPAGVLPSSIDWTAAHTTGTMSLHLNPISSFSVDANEAWAFAVGNGYQLVVGAEVPVERILSTAQTGFGAKLEGEMTVLGSTSDDFFYEAMNANAVVESDTTIADLPEVPETPNSGTPHGAFVLPNSSYMTIPYLQHLPPIDEAAEAKVVQAAKDALTSDGLTTTDAIDQLGQQIHDYIDQRIGPLANAGNEAYQMMQGGFTTWTDAQRAWIADGDTSLHNGISFFEAQYKYAQALRDETIRLLGQARDLGGVDLSTITTDPKFNQTVADALTQASDLYPADWLEASNSQGDLYVWRDRGAEGEGYYFAGPNVEGKWMPGDAVIASHYRKNDPAGQLLTTMIHELGHRFEDAVGGMWQAEQALYDTRTAGEDLVDLTNGVTAKTRLDQWADQYIGRIPYQKWRPNYATATVVDKSGEALQSFYSYEIVSTGFEWVLGQAYDSARYLSQDEAFHRFILGLLFGWKDHPIPVTP